MGNFHLEFGYVLAWENEAVWGKDSEYPCPRHRDMIRRIYERFGAKVMLWGADMPWAQRACTYKQCIDTIRHHTEFMTDKDRHLVLGETPLASNRVSPNSAAVGVETNQS